MLKMIFEYKKATKNCYCYESVANETTLYLKKEQIKTAGLDPQKRIIVRVNQQEESPKGP